MHLIPLESAFTIFWCYHRLEVLNERRSGVVQMVKLAEKERDNLEVRLDHYIIYDLLCS